MRLLTSLLCTILTAALLAGCGGSSDNGVAAKTPAEILAASKTAATKATAVHITSAGAIKKSTFASNLYLATNGGEGHVKLLGLSFDVVRTGDTIYVKGNPIFNAQLGAATGLRIPPNTWLKGSTQNGPLTQLAQSIELRSTVAGYLTVLNPATSPLSKGANTKIHGQPTVEVKRVAKLYTGAYYIATTGQPYPLQILRHGRETGQTTFTDWNQPHTITPPTNTVDISQLPHAGG